MSRKILGIDIKNRIVSAVLLTSSLRDSRIDAHWSLPITGPGDAANGLTAALETIINSMDVRDCDCAVAVPAEFFSFRNLKVPFDNSKKIRMVLPFELEPTLPYPIEDIELDFDRLDSSGGDHQTEVLAAIVPKSRLAPVLEALSAFRLEPELLTIGGQTAALCAAKHMDNRTDQVFLDLETGHGTLFIIQSGRIKLIRSFQLPPSESAAGQAVCRQIQQTLMLYADTYGSEIHPATVIVGGGSPVLDPLSRAIAGSLELQVQQTDFVNQLELSFSNEDIDPWHAAVMDNALALALAEAEGQESFNFFRSQFPAKKFLAKHKDNLVKTGILAAAVCVLLFANLIIDNFTLGRHLRRLDQQMADTLKATFPDVGKIVDPYQQMKIQYQEARQATRFQTDTENSIRSIDILSRISQSVPAGIDIDVTRMVIAPDSVLMTGSTDTFNSVDDIKSNLEKIEFFKKVTISSANIDRSGNEVRFQIKMEM